MKLFKKKSAHKNMSKCSNSSLFCSSNCCKYLRPRMDPVLRVFSVNETFRRAFCSPTKSTMYSTCLSFWHKISVKIMLCQVFAKSSRLTCSKCSTTSLRTSRPPKLSIQKPSKRQPRSAFAKRRQLDRGDRILYVQCATENLDSRHKLSGKTAHQWV